MDAHVLVQIVAAAERPFATPDWANPRCVNQVKKVSYFIIQESEEVSLTFIVRVNGPNVPFEVLAPDEALAAPVNMTSVCPGALLGLILAERIHRLP